MRYSKEDQKTALDNLRQWFPVGSTVHTILRHVSRSGMQRDIGVVAILPDGDVRHPNYATAAALGLPLGKCDSVKVGGCGMDMGYHLAYSISASLYRDGFGCIGEGCPSNDHSNGDRDYTPHQDHTGGDPSHVCATSPETCTAKRHWHRDGGYALKHRWL